MAGEEPTLLTEGEVEMEDFIETSPSLDLSAVVLVLFFLRPSSSGLMTGEEPTLLTEGEVEMEDFIDTSLSLDVSAVMLVSVVSLMASTSVYGRWRK
jgi:hypothetical protein